MNKITIQGISHITFICADLAKSVHLFQEVFAGEIIYSSGDKTFSIAKEVFLQVGGLWIALMEGESIEKSYNHVAFQVDEELIPLLEEKIRALGLTILPGRKRKEAEGCSLYFYDYDNHLFELHSGELERRLAFYNK